MTCTRICKSFGICGKTKHSFIDPFIHSFIEQILFERLVCAFPLLLNLSLWREWTSPTVGEEERYGGRGYFPSGFQFAFSRGMVNSNALTTQNSLILFLLIAPELPSGRPPHN